VRHEAIHAYDHAVGHESVTFPFGLARLKDKHRLPGLLQQDNWDCRLVRRCSGDLARGSPGDPFGGGPFGGSAAASR
jgi:hypothetical protein